MNMSIVKSAKFPGIIIEFKYDNSTGKLFIYAREEYILWTSDKAPENKDDIIIQDLKKIYNLK